MSQTRVRALTLLRCMLSALIALAGSDVMAQSITILAPNGGETFTAGTTTTIRWQSSGIASDDELEVEFTSGGSQWRRITRVSGSATQATWTVDNRPGADAKVRVVSKDEEISDESDGVFTITEDPLDRTRVISPNGGEVWVSGEQRLITWQLPLDAIQGLLEYSTNFGVNWQTIATLPGTTTQYLWTVPEVPATVNSALIRISMAEDVEHFDISDDAFTISPKPIITTPATVAVTYPNGGEKLVAGSTIIATWEFTAATGDDDETETELALEYSLDSGVTWAEIATEDATDGGHDWTIPNMPTKRALVRVREIGGSLIDISDSTFEIIGTTTLAVLTPIGGEVWTEGESRTITWNATNAEGDVSIYLITTPNGSEQRSLLGTMGGAVRSLSWNVPRLSDQTMQAWIEVELGSATARSNAFVIQPKPSANVKMDRGSIKLNVFPNPATDHIRLTWDPETLQPSMIRVMNAVGVVVKTATIQRSAVELRLTVADLATGLYVYELSGGGQPIRGALSIQR